MKTANFYFARCRKMLPFVNCQGQQGAPKDGTEQRGAEPTKLHLTPSKEMQLRRVAKNWYQTLCGFRCPPQRAKTSKTRQTWGDGQNSHLPRTPLPQTNKTNNLKLKDTTIYLTSRSKTRPSPASQPSQPRAFPRRHIFVAFGIKPAAKQHVEKLKTTFRILKP